MVLDLFRIHLDGGDVPSTESGVIGAISVAARAIGLANGSNSLEWAISCLHKVHNLYTRFSRFGQ